MARAALVGEGKSFWRRRVNWAGVIVGCSLRFDTIGFLSCLYVSIGILSCSGRKLPEIIQGHVHSRGMVKGKLHEIHDVPESSRLHPGKDRRRFYSPAHCASA